MKVFAFSKGVQKQRPQKLQKELPGRPRSCSGGPKSAKSRQERPKKRPRAARSAPKGPQARPWAPKVRQEALREAPGAHVGLILGGPGLHFQAIEASFSKLARAPPDNRKHSSKLLVKRSSVGLACVWGQKTQPRRGSSRFLRPRLLSLRIQLASQACFSHVGPHKPTVFTWFRAFHAFLRPPVVRNPRLEIIRKCGSESSKGPSRPKQKLKKELPGRPK